MDQIDVTAHQDVHSNDHTPMDSSDSVEKRSQGSSPQTLQRASHSSQPQGTSWKRIFNKKSTPKQAESRKVKGRIVKRNKPHQLPTNQSLITSFLSIPTPIRTPPNPIEPQHSEFDLSRGKSEPLKREKCTGALLGNC